MKNYEKLFMFNLSMLHQMAPNDGILITSITASHSMLHQMASNDSVQVTSITSIQTCFLKHISGSIRKKFGSYKQEMYLRKQVWMDVMLVTWKLSLGAT